MDRTANRLARLIAVAMLLPAGLVFLWLTFVPSGMDTIFGEDEFDPLAGLVVLALSTILSIGILRRSRRTTWAGLAFAVLATLLWVWVFTSTELSVTGLLASVYGIAAIALGVVLLTSSTRRTLERSAIRRGEQGRFGA